MKKDWYEFSMLIQGVDFLNDEPVLEDFQLQMKLALIKLVNEHGLSIKIASVSLTKGTTRKVHNPETVEIG